MLYSIFKRVKVTRSYPVWRFDSLTARYTAVCEPVSLAVSDIQNNRESQRHSGRCRPQTVRACCPPVHSGSCLFRLPSLAVLQGLAADSARVPAYIRLLFCYILQSQIVKSHSLHVIYDLKGSNLTNTM